MRAGYEKTLKLWENANPQLWGNMAWKLIVLGRPEDATIEIASSQIKFCRAEMKDKPDDSDYYQWQIDALKGAIKRGEIKA